MTIFLIGAASLVVGSVIIVATGIGLSRHKWFDE